MRRESTAFTALLLLFLAIAFQIPAVKEMATRLLRQSTHSVRGLLPHYKGRVLPAFLISSNINSQSSSHFHTSPKPQDSSSASKSIMANAQPFLAAVENRRTFYQMTNESTIPDARIKELVAHTIKHTPSSFNSQTTRAVVVLKEKHQQLWDIIMEVYKAMLSAEAFEHAKGRMTGFKSGYGTVLWYEDTSRVREFQEKFKSYEDKFPQWSDQTNGMHQYVLWTALEAEGMGVNLQHYNPLIDARLQTEYGVPETWNLKSQLVFGKPTGQPGEKTFQPIEERVKYFE